MDSYESQIHEPIQTMTTQELGIKINILRGVAK